MKKVTIQTIASEAGVSKATVSRALNSSGYVQEEIRQHIFKVADELGYTKVQRTRPDKKEHHTTVAVVFPSLTADFFGAIIDGISSLADEMNISILLFSTQDSVEKEKRILLRLRDLRVSGLIFIPVAAYDGIEGWNKLQAMMAMLHLPIVLVDRSDKRLKCDSIVYDNYNGAYLLGEKLVSEGCAKIGAIIGDTCLELGLDRDAGFRHALSVGGKSISEDFYYTDERIISSKMAYEFTTRKIKEGKLPEGVFLSNSLIANGFFKALFENNLMPGRDVRCMGFDFLDLLNVMDLEYSYLDRETYQTGRMAMQMLLDHYKTDIISKREFVIPAKLVR